MKIAGVVLFAASVVGAGVTIQAVASGDSGNDQLPTSGNTRLAIADEGRHRAAELPDDRIGDRTHQNRTHQGEVERRVHCRHAGAGDDHSNDGVEVGDDHGDDGVEVGDDHGDDGPQSGDDNHSGQGGGGDDRHGDDHGGGGQS